MELSHVPVPPHGPTQGADHVFFDPWKWVLISNVKRVGQDWRLTQMIVAILELPAGALAHFDPSSLPITV